MVLNPTNVILSKVVNSPEREPNPSYTNKSSNEKYVGMCIGKRTRITQNSTTTFAKPESQQPNSPIKILYILDVCGVCFSYREPKLQKSMIALAWHVVSCPMGHSPSSEQFLAAKSNVEERTREQSQKPKAALKARHLHQHLKQG